MTSFGRIPNMSALREGKVGYATRYGDIDTSHPLHNDPLVDPRDFGINGSSYYSQPDEKTGVVLPGVPDAPLLRRDVVKRMLLAQEFLRTDSDVRRLLGAPAELRIAEGLRPYIVQKFAYEVAWPAIIKQQNSDMSDEEVQEILPKYIAKPSTPKTATPHLTGGAVDVALVNAETGEDFDRGHEKGAVKGTVVPDFHEGYHLTPGQSDIVNTPEQKLVADPDSIIVWGRRIMFHAMTVVAGMYCNPDEIWHYGIGDPLSAYVSGTRAYYGIADPPEWYVQKLESLGA